MAGRPLLLWRAAVGLYKAQWNRQPILTLAVVAGVATRAGTLTEDQAYRIVKAVVEDNSPAGGGLQADAFKTIKGEDLAKLTIETATTPVHAGAQKSYSELGLRIPERLRSPEAR